MDAQERKWRNEFDAIEDVAHSGEGWMLYYVACTKRHAEAKALREEIERLKHAYQTYEMEIQQTLGKALGYPWFKDDLANFPDATESNGVCVGDHVAASIAAEAADKIVLLQEENARLRKALEKAIADLIMAQHDVSDWGVYASEYFQEKHRLADDVKFYEDAAKAAAAALEERQ